MNKEELILFSNERILKNLNEFSVFFDFECEIFYELKSLIFEINNCLIFEFYTPALTATNFLTERLLKIALIYNDTGLEKISPKEWNQLYELPHKKYSKITLSNSIEKCRKFGLIDDKEKQYLNNIIREIIRNGFSHADSTKITDKFQFSSKAYLGDLKIPGQIEEIEINKSIVPTFQNLILKDFAEKNAKFYFKFIFELIPKIEQRIKYFNKIK